MKKIILALFLFLMFYSGVNANQNLCPENFSEHLTYNNLKFFTSSKGYNFEKFYVQDLDTNDIVSFGRHYVDDDPSNFERKHEIRYGCMSQNKNSIIIKMYPFMSASSEQFCVYDLDKLSQIVKNGLQISPGYCSFDKFDFFSAEDSQWTSNEKIKFTACKLGDCEISRNGIIYESNITDDNITQIGARFNDKEILKVFSDLSINNPLFFKIYEAVSLGFINGYPDNTIRLENEVNRAEFAKMLMLAFKEEEQSGVNLKGFPDVQMDQWYVPFLSKAVQLNMMKGYPDGTMKPGGTINKAEALKMVVQVLKSNNIPLQEQFDEVSEKLEADAEWYEKYRQFALFKNWDLDFLEIKDMPEFMTRGECIELILEALGSQGVG